LRDTPLPINYKTQILSTSLNTVSIDDFIKLLSCNNIVIIDALNLINNVKINQDVVSTTDKTKLMELISKVPNNRKKFIQYISNLIINIKNPIEKKAQLVHNLFNLGVIFIHYFSESLYNAFDQIIEYDHIAITCSELTKSIIKIKKFCGGLSQLTETMLTTHWEFLISMIIFISNSNNCHQANMCAFLLNIISSRYIFDSYQYGGHEGILIEMYKNRYYNISILPFLDSNSIKEINTKLGIISGRATKGAI